MYSIEIQSSPVGSFVLKFVHAVTAVSAPARETQFETASEDSKLQMAPNPVYPVRLHLCG